MGSPPSGIPNDRSNGNVSQALDLKIIPPGAELDRGARALFPISVLGLVEEVYSRKL